MPDIFDTLFGKEPDDIPDTGPAAKGKTSGSKGKHGGGHKDRDRGATASDKKAAERAKQAAIAKARGLRDTSGSKGKPSGK